jgi:hypothetical protein
MNTIAGSNLYDSNATNNVAGGISGMCSFIIQLTAAITGTAGVSPAFVEYHIVTIEGFNRDLIDRVA